MANETRPLTVTPADVPEPARPSAKRYLQALEQFRDIDAESARIDCEDMKASSITCAINSVIRRSELYKDVRAVVRCGQAYLIKISEEEN